jgi:hypothetical protein
LFILSFFITVSVTIYKTTLLYTDSIIRRHTGSIVLNNLFWKVVLFKRGRNSLQNITDNDRETRNNIV